MRDNIIQWTGDNRDEMIKFCPYLIEFPYDYADWPYIQAIGIQESPGVFKQMRMRDYLVKHDCGRYRVVRSYETRE